MCCGHSFPLSALSYPHHYLRTCSACEEDNSKFIISIESILISSAHRQGQACTCSSQHTPETVLPALWSAFPFRTLKTMVGYSSAQALIFFLKLGAQIPCCSTCFPGCWAETKSKRVIFQTHQASAPSRCAVALGEHGCWLVCCVQAVKPQQRKERVTELLASLTKRFFVKQHQMGQSYHSHPACSFPLALP